ncbi:MAG: phosphoribosylaminoimidazolesuccinocarboxamide synthase [Candidatus Bipolaricaulota bacterium]|nr:phosphoribosylaminoimidazolesuccinocarboxamide synthase [Candidatus Bipolaricaulota bacterium]MDW8141345.1 phosphoribosylaminoimidazolesuccinocarboxamide synthase [Candidatus Bipolaricaulota bacterium]
MTLLYDGKAKTLFAGPHPQTVIVAFKDTATAGNAQKRATFPGKGTLCNAISCKLFEHLAAHGLPSHYIRKLTEQSFLAHKVQIIPLEVVVRNRATGSLTKRLGIPRGQPLQPPLVEFFYKSDPLGDPLLCESHIFALELATQNELREIQEQALQANKMLREYFAELQLLLIDMKFEFGKTPNGQILLADEISPDTLRLWDAQTKESLDKDVFREEKGDLLTAYREVARRMGLL